MRLGSFLGEGVGSGLDDLVGFVGLVGLGGDGLAGAGLDLDLEGD